MPPTKKPKRLRRRKKSSALKDLNPEQPEQEIDFETLVREEYMRLHRKYRLMEDVRRTIAEQGNKVSLRGKLLGYLRDQKQSILTDVLNATSDEHKRKDKETIRTMLTILQDFENCNQDILSCVKNILEMEENVDKITKRLVDQKLKVQAIYGRSMTVGQADKKKNTLENRLYHVVTQFDKNLASNRYIREEINMMLKARGLFHARSMAIKKQSSRIKSQMGDVVYLATTAYEQRDDLVARINAIRERNDKESKQHVLEIKEFNRVLHHDSKLHGFMLTKNGVRSLLESHEQREERKNHTKLTDLVATLKAYKRSFKEIIGAGSNKGLTTEELAVEYLENEQVNFSRFRVLTDLNNEISFLHQGVLDTVQVIEKMYVEKKEVKKQRRVELDIMLKSYELKNKKLEQLEKLGEQAEKQMHEVIKLLEEVFIAANCDHSSIIRLLGNIGGIGPHNCMLCMSAIENRVSEMMFDKQLYEIRKSVEINNANLPKLGKLGTQGVRHKHGGGPYIPQLMITGRLDAEEEDEEKSSRIPLQYEELRVMLLIKEPDLKIPGVILPEHPILAKSRMSNQEDMKSNTSIPASAVSTPKKSLIPAS